MADELYEGWSNRETWGANLWLANDEGLYRQTMELVADAYRNHGERTAEGYLADAIKEMFEELFDPDENEQTATIVNVRNDIGSMWRVDWYEIAASWLSDYPEDEDQ